MICIISGLETNNKVNNQPIHEDVVSLAKSYIIDNECSMNEALKSIAKMLFTDIKTKLENGEVPHE